MGLYDERARELYLAGKTRKQAMDELGITNPNVMASLSHRLRLHWSWPLENRKGGTVPTGAEPPKAPPSTSKKPRFGSRIVTASSQKNVVRPGTSIDTVETRTLLPPTPGFVSARERRLRGIVDTEDVGKPITAYVKDPDDLEAARFLEEHYARQYG